MSPRLSVLNEGKTSFGTTNADHMFKNLLNPIEELTADLIDRVSDLLIPAPDNFEAKAKSRSVELPRDLYAHREVETEWWYYTGHCQTEYGREFGFELVFFKRRTDRDRLGLLPLRALANPMYFAHFAISEIGRKKFQYDHRRSFNQRLDMPAEMREDEYSLTLGDWTIRERDGTHMLHAGFADGLTFDARLESTKPVVLNGNKGIGVSRKDVGEESSHFSFTRMSVSGEIVKNGRTERFSGSAWMDREFGTWKQRNWDWFSIQLDDATELMIYHFRDDEGKSRPVSDEPEIDSGTFVDTDGKCMYLKRVDFELTPTATWKSPATGAEYSSRWTIAVPSLDMELEIVPLIDHQELDTRGTTMIIYWEGACSVTGTRAGLPVDGRAYVELVGYDRSHESLALSDFLIEDTMRRIAGMFG
jgi:predicted secreted hydrolase